MAAPVDAGSIYSDVRIRLDRLTADIKAVNTGFDKLGKNLRDDSDKTTKKQTENFKQVGLAGVAAIGAITIAFKKSVSVFADTEQSLANVEAVSNATAAEFRELEQAASDAGTTTRFTAGQAADALFFLSSAGLSATESVKALDGVLLLAGATGSDLAFSAQTITSTLSQFGLAADKAADVSNIFAAANSNSQATLDKLASSLRQAGPVAAGLGIGLEEVVGSLQALFNAGFKGEQAGTALRNALGDLANQASPTVEKLNALGVSFESVNPEAVGLTGAISALADAGLSTGEVFEAFGKEVGPQLLTLIKVGQDGLEDYTDTVTGTTEAARQYSVQNDTLSGSIDALKSAVEGTSNSFVETLSPAFRGIIDLIAGLLRIINKLPDFLKGIGAGAGVAAGGFLALSKALAILGITLSTGPLAIVAGLSAAAVGLTVLVNKAKEAREVKLAEEFGDLARELGFAGQAVDDFSKKAGAIERFLLPFGKLTEDISETEALVLKLSDSFEFTAEEIIKIGLASEKVTDTYKEQLKTIQKQLIEQEDINALIAQQISIEDAIALSKVNQSRVAARVASEQALANEEAEKKAERLEEIKTRLITLDELALSGALTESAALEEKKALREEEIQLLLDQAISSGEVTDQVVSDIATQQAAVDRYSERLEELAAQEADELEKEKTRNEESAQAWADLSQGRIDRHAEALEQIGIDAETAAEEEAARQLERQEGYATTYEIISGAAQTFFSALVALRQANADAEIAEIERTRDAELEAIDARTQALLESLGLQEETKKESLQRQLDEAILAGETETAENLKQELLRNEILEAAEAEKAVIEKAAAKEAAKLKYDAEIAAWNFSKASTIFTGAEAAIKAYGSLAGIPFVGPVLGAAAAAAVGVATLAQVAAIKANKPQLPQLQTGGIILPQSGGTAALLAENGAPELALNAGTEGEGLLNLFAQKVAAAQSGGPGGTFTLILERDGRKEAQAVVEYINNGVVRLAI